MSLFHDAERSPITTILCVGAIAAFLAEASGRSVDHLVLTPLDALTEPWRYITTIFPHGGLMHVGFNLLWTWQLGRGIEDRLGPVKMLGLVLLAAIAASGTELLMFNAAIGLSGVVYAFATFAWFRGRHDARFQGIIDRSTVKFLAGWFLLCIVLTQADLMQIANGAHAGGAIMGFLLAQRRLWLAPLFLAALGAGIFLRVGRGSASTPAYVLHKRAEAAIQSGENGKAITLYDKLFDNGDRTPGAVYNYGLALYRNGQPVEAMDAFIRAFELDPQVIQDVDLRQSIIHARAQRDGN